MIPQEKIEQIKDANDIVEVLSEYLQVKKAGGSYRALCPFHQEKTPSFMISPAKQIFHCFGCHAGGNVFTFIQKIENISFIESVKILAKRSGIELENFRPSPGYEERDRILEINREAMNFFTQSLSKSKKALDYAASRGISAEASAEFKLGYAPEGAALYQHLKARGFDDGLILKSWLCKKGDYGIQDSFRDRLVFPILNIYGEPVAFGARVFGDGVPKYINSAETPIYTKGRHLYNLNNAKKAREGYMVVVEGYMDAVTLYSGGIKNVVATLGTAMTEEQAKLLKRYSSVCVMAYDMDEAGVSGAMRGGEIAFGEGLEVRIASYIGAKDPDEFIKKNGAEALKERFDKSEPLVQYKAEYLKANGDIKNPYYREKAIKEMVSLLEKTDNVIVRNDGIRKSAEILDVPPEIAAGYLKSGTSAVQESASVNPEKGGLSREKGVIAAERAIAACGLYALGREDEQVTLRHMISRREATGTRFEDFTGKLYARIIEAIETRFKAGDKDIVRRIQLDFIDDTELSRLSAELLAEAGAFGSFKDTDTVMRVIDDCYGRLERERARMLAEGIQEKIRKAEAAGDMELVMKLVAEKQQAQKILKQRGGEFE